MVNFGPLPAEIGSLVWGTLANFNGIASLLRFCSDVAQRKPTKLHDVWPSPGTIHYIYIFVLNKVIFVHYLQNTESPIVITSAHHRTSYWGYILATTERIDNRKKKKNLLHSNISLTCSHNMVKFGPLGAEIGSLVWGTQRISTGFASWLRY